MEQWALDFTVRDDIDPAPVPFQRGSHTSYKAALALAKQGRGQKLRRLLRAYYDAWECGLTDSEAATRAMLLRQSVCSLRKALREPGLIFKRGERPGGYGPMQTVWVLSPEGRAVVEASQ